MTEDFKAKMNVAMEDGILEAKKENKKYLEQLKYNQQIANLYMELVLAFVKTYNFSNGVFDVDKVNKDVFNKFGKPNKARAWITNETQKGTIALDYSAKQSYWGREGEPEFKNNKDFDLGMVNLFLAENGIQVIRDSVDDGGFGTENDCISFDASMLIEAKYKLAEEISIQKIKGLS